MYRVGVKTVLEIALVDAQTVTLLCECRNGVYCPCATKAMVILCEAICEVLTGAAAPRPARSAASPTR